MNVLCICKIPYKNAQEQITLLCVLLSETKTEQSALSKVSNNFEKTPWISDSATTWKGDEEVQDPVAAKHMQKIVES